MATIVVTPGSSIQQAINAAVDGDIVIVSSGTYKEALTITGKRITLASKFYNTGDTSDIASTILDGGANGRDALDLITVANAPGTKIIGFTIKNGNDGIQIDNSTDVEIINNIISNTVDGIDFKGKTSGVIRQNILENNTDDGVDLNDGAAVVVEDNTIRNNDGDGLEIRLEPYTGNTLDIIIRNNLIAGNNNDGIQLIDSAGLSNRYIRIEKNRIEGNTQAGLGLMDNEETTEDYRAASIPEPIDVLNNTFFGNNYGLTGGDNLVALNNIFAGHTKIAMKGVDGGSIAAYNLFWQNGTDILDSNVNANTTLFTNPLLDANLQLQAGSPAIDAGIAAFQWRGKDVLNLPSSGYKGSAPDLGAWESGFTTQPLGSIGDRIWNDTDGDGVQDTGESGIAGITVKLLNSSNNIIATQITGSNGNYLFNNLLTNTYYVQVDKNTLPSGTTQTGDPDGGNDNTAKVILAEGQNNLNQDFGYQLPPLGSIGDRIWNDGNSDGVQDTGETGIAGVSVKLLDSANKLLATQVTGSNGNYLFDKLLAGTYTVQVDKTTLPSGNTQTGDPDTVKDDSSQVTLAAGENKLNLDFGYKLPAAPKVIEVRVSASSDDAEQKGTSVDLDSTDIELVNDGSNQTVGLRFNNIQLPKGVTITNAYIQFQVDEVSTSATNLTIQGQAIDNAPTFTTASNNISSRSKTTASVAWNPAAWNTLGAAGVDQRTPNLAAVIQEIINRPGWASGNSVATIISGTGARVAESFDGDGLAALLHIEYSDKPVGAIGDRIWNDTDGDGVQDTGETGIAGVSVKLLDAANNIVATQVTGSNGNYLFGSLQAGTYTVQVDKTTLLSGATQTSDPDSVKDSTSIVNLTEGQNNLNQDFGYQLPLVSTIGDRIWHDTDGDGTQDTDENGIAGITVKLLDSGNNVLFTQETGSNGNYLFNNLQAGTYTVQVDSSKLPSGITQTGDPDTIKDNTAKVTLAAGENKLDQDFGYKLPTSTKAIEVKVSASSDDAEQRISGKMSLDSSDLELINDSGNDQLVGLRFVGVNIPQKAIITNAYIQFKVDEASSVATNLTIHGEDVDNAATFTTTSGNISSRVRTDASVIWKDVPIWNTVDLASVEQRTPNLKDVIQEIVNRSGWSSGNSLATIISGTGSRVAQSFERTPVGVGSPVLHVEFTS